MATTTSFKVNCPSCDASVSIKNASLVGKKVDCPKCKYRFVVEAPVDETAAANKKAGQGGGTAVAKKPAKKAALGDDSEATPKKKPNTILYAGIGIGVLAIAILGGALAMGVFDDDSPKPTPPANKGNSNQQGSGDTPKPPDNGSNEPKDNGPSLPSINRDITNLLPNDVQWAMMVDVPEALKTSGGTILFDQAKGTGAMVKDNLGFAVDNISKLLGSGGEDGSWTFTVLKTKSNFQLETLKAAMEITTAPINVNRRDYYVVKDNELLNAVGNYFANKVKELGFTLTKKTDRVMTICQLDSKTLVIADQAQMVKFLNDNAAPKNRTTLTTAPPPQPMNPMMGMMGYPGYPGMGMYGMMGFPMGMMGYPGMGMMGMGGPVAPPPMPLMPPKPMSAKSDKLPEQTAPPPMVLQPPGAGMMGLPPGMGFPPGMGIPPGMGYPGMGMMGGTPAPTGPKTYSSVPTYLTIDPYLKQMLNQFEDDKKPIVNFAIRISDAAHFFAAMLKLAMGDSPLAGLPLGLVDMANVPKRPVVGFALYEFNSQKFNARLSADADTDEQAKTVMDFLKLAMPFIAAEISKQAEIPVRPVVPNDGNSGNMGFPGGMYPGGMFPPGGMYPMPPGGMFPGAPAPPGAPSIPPPPGRPFGASRNDSTPNTPTQGAPPPPPPPPPGGMMGMPMFPGGMGGYPGYPGMGMGGYPGYPGMGMGGYPGMGMGGTNDPGSTATLSRSDRTVSVTIDLEWGKDYAAKVAGPLRDYFDGVAGQSMLLAGKHPWHKLPPAFKRFEANGKFPQAAYPRRPSPNRLGLPYGPEQRVSWMVELLPQLGYGSLAGKIDREKAWNDKDNLAAGRAWIPEFLDPSQNPDTWRAALGSVNNRELGATHFVGLSGIGEDAAELDDSPANAARLGVFGYDRQAAFADIQKGDGLANTAIMAQVPANIARPWIRGGGSTVQGVPEKGSIKPFVTRQANNSFGTHVLMADGSVRFVRATAADEVFKAMVTYKAGDKIDNFDAAVPKVDLNSSRLKTPTLPKSVDPLANVPQGWTGVGVKVIPNAAFALAMPTTKFDDTANRPEEKHITGVADGGLVYAVHLYHNPMFPKSDADGSAAQAEIAKYAQRAALTVEGEPKAGPMLGTSQGRDFRTKAAQGDTSGINLSRLWVMNQACLVLTVRGPADLKPETAEAYFKTVRLDTNTLPTEATKYVWQDYYATRLTMGIKFPKDYGILGADKLFLFWPKDADGGATFLFTLQDASYENTDDQAKKTASLKKLIEAGAFGEKPTGVKVRNLDEKHSGFTFDCVKGDSPYTNWVLATSNDSALMLSVRKNAGVTPRDEKLFFDSLYFGPPRGKLENPGMGGMGMPGTGGPMMPPGGGGGAPPPPPPPPPPMMPPKPGGR